MSLIKPPRIRRIVLQSTFFIILILLLALNAKQWYRGSKQGAEINALRSGIQALENDERSMGELLESLKSPLYIEREGRTRLGYKKEGESTVIFPAGNEVSGGYSDEAEDARQRPPYAAEWFQYFFPRE